ncbi:MAG: NAD(+) synthase [Bacteriovoracales bacterium]|nr:NAD(+) synthase [Bacteriovoracales bacterium]
MKIYLHQTHHSIADLDGIFSYLEEQMGPQKSPGLHLFPEGQLVGYPLQDLYLDPSFIGSFHKALEKFNAFSTSMEREKEGEEETLFLLGGPEYEYSSRSTPRGIPQNIYNSIYAVSPGHPLKPIYRKQLLPGYDIFDEPKYFTPGTENKVLSFRGKKLALLICEDMWSSPSSPCDPVSLLGEEGAPLDLIVNLSASPFHLEKDHMRTERAKEVCHHLRAPLAYVNRVGGEDGILFDGGSFVAHENGILAKAPFFEKNVLVWEMPSSPKKENVSPPKVPKARPRKGAWESLFHFRLDDRNPPQIRPLNRDDLDLALAAIQFGLREYADKNGFQKFLVALSGGLDSALVLTLTKLALAPGLTLEALSMPGNFTSPKSNELTRSLCEKLEVPCRFLPIKFLHASSRQAFLSAFDSPLEGIADENIQSRLRALFLYARSNQDGAMVVNTSNKSELSVGYSTQYGDGVGAVSPLGDLYKSEVYQLAHHINDRYGSLIDPEILGRPPSAELRPGQKDSDSLPEYPVLDAILEGLTSYGLSVSDLVERGHRREDVEKVRRLQSLSEFKRSSFCPVIKLKFKSYGFGHRVPISKKL